VLQRALIGEGKRISPTNNAIPEKMCIWNTGGKVAC
jgi:hypothetical protein